MCLRTYRRQISKMLAPPLQITLAVAVTRNITITITEDIFLLYWTLAAVDQVKIPGFLQAIIHPTTPVTIIHLYPNIVTLTKDLPVSILAWFHNWCKDNSRVLNNKTKVNNTHILYRNQYLILLKILLGIPNLPFLLRKRMVHLTTGRICLKISVIITIFSKLSSKLLLPEICTPTTIVIKVRLVWVTTTTAEAAAIIILVW